MEYSLHAFKRHAETHLVHRAGWLRAAVLGANDGILSTAGIVTGMAASGSGHAEVLLAGIAGMAAGAASMAAGEYVSVSSQSDTEKADLAREKRELAANTAHEQEELAQIYVSRGLEVTLARQVAHQLMAHDALGAHARDELGISGIAAPKPLQAAASSAVSFSCGALLPLLAAAVMPVRLTAAAVFVISLFSLGLLGVLSARTSGVSVLRPTLRITLWGILSMCFTYTLGLLLGAKL